MIMQTMFEIKVEGRDMMYTEYFRLADTSKVNAMKRAIKLARLADNVKGEVLATAKVAREEPFTPGICV